MTLRLHHLNASRSLRLVLLIEELGLDCEIVHHSRDPETRLAPPALLDVHPMGKAPLLEDDGVVIAETGAIAEYLLARHDPEHRMHPRADSPDFPRYLEWLHSAEGAPFLPGLLVFYLASSGLDDHGLAGRMREEAKKAAVAIEAHLSRHPFFAGESYSAADCLMLFQIRNTAMRSGLDGLPATRAWLDRVEARPAFKRMLEIGI